MPLSQNRMLRPLCALGGTFSLAFGLSAFISPATSLSLFNLNYPDHAPSKPVVDGLMIVYGVRDVYMGFSIMIAALYGDLRVLGWLYVACGGVAVVDGLVCRGVGDGGEWSHWGFTPVAVGMGLVCLGVFDGKGGKIKTR